ncbi:MAG: flagellar basal body-associated FliL family protein [Mobilitalea sp.]
MKKNMLTIVILALSVINIILSAVIIFAIVPTANKTTQLVDKIASIVDLEMESEAPSEPAVADLKIHTIPDKLTINLADSGDGISHYAILTVSISVDSKNADAVTVEPVIETNANEIKEIVTEEFAKYTMADVTANKDQIKEQVLVRIQEYFKSDCITNISFGNILMQ